MKHFVRICFITNDRGTHTTDTRIWHDLQKYTYALVHFVMKQERENIYFPTVPVNICANFFLLFYKLIHYKYQLT